MEAATAGVLLGATLTALTPGLPSESQSAGLIVCGLLLAIVMRTWPVGWALIGAGWFACSAHHVLADRLPDELVGRDVIVEGRIASVPEIAGSRIHFLFEPDRRDARDGIPARLRLSWYDAPSPPAPDRRWRLQVRLRPAAGTANPGVFDYERWLFERRIGASGYIRDSPVNRPLGSAGPPGRLLRLRQDAAAGVGRALGNGQAAAIVTALTLGLRGDLERATREALRATGTAHLMAISGLHVGMVAALGMLAGRFAWNGLWRVAKRPPRGPGRRATGAAIGWVFAFAYTLLAGAGLPARRALLMLSVALLMLLWRRRLGSWAPLAGAAAVLFAVDPLAVLSPGFWLSLVAVAGLIAGGYGRLATPGPAATLVAAQWSVGLALLLPGLLVFGGLPVVGPLVNLVAVPLFALVVVPLALIGLVILALSPALAAAVWLPLGGLLEGLLWVLAAIAAVPGAWVSPARSPLWALAAAGVAALALFLPSAVRIRLAVVVLIVPVLCWRPPPLADGTYRVTVLDVGQGLSVVVETRAHVLVFDAGPAWRSGRDAGDSIVVPFLEAAGIAAIDALILSHGDGDHRGGARSLQRQMTVRRSWVGPDVPVGFPAAMPCRAGTSWRWDGVDFRFLHPPREGGYSGNDSSCVLLVSGVGGRTLLTGDIEARGEAAVRAGGVDLSADLVVAPHHGSRTSSTTDFVSAVSAVWVVFPAGYGNRWGFPAQEVVARWLAAGASHWSTGEAGAVQVEFATDGPVAAPLGWRCRQRRFWRRARCPPRDSADRVPGQTDSQYHSAFPARAL